jgi:prevent-host-death family protein
MSRTLPISDVKAHLPELVAGVQNREEEIIVTRNGRPAAVLINFEEYERVRETLSILADSEFSRLVQKGRKDFAKGGKGAELESVFSVPPRKPVRATSRRR